MQSVTKGNEEKWVLFGRKVLRSIYGRVVENGEHKMKTDKDVYQIHLKHDIQRFLLEAIGMGGPSI